MSGRRPVTPGGPSGSAPEWIQAARPPVPPELVPWLAGAQAHPDVEGLTEAALEALRRAEAPPRSRDGSGDRTRAFHLLAADGLLTYACQAVLSEEPPGGHFRALARRVSAGASGQVTDRG